HPVIGKRAAIKVLNREFSANAGVVSRFVSEARAVNQIRHRNIIDIFAFGTLEGGLQYFVMELLDGETLDEFLEKRGRISLAEAIPILRYIARALDAAHEAGIAHRDLKPENVFLTSDDEGGRYPKLLDFGIAKLMGDDSVTHKTRTGAAMGTPLYMSPEQCHGKGIDHRTDIYSFGVMTFQMLTGSVPFDGESMMELMLKHVQEAPPSVTRFAPDLPGALDAPITHMMAKKPDDRPKSLVSAVDQLIGAAQGAGIELPIRSSSGSQAVLPSEGARRVTVRTGDHTPAEAAMGATVADTGGAVAATTQQTMESSVPVANGSSGKTIAIAVGALIIGIGATVFATRGGKEPDAPPNAGDDGPAAVAPPASPPSGVAGPMPEPDPDPVEPAAPATGSAVPSAAPTAAAPVPRPAYRPPVPPPPPVEPKVAPPPPPPKSIDADLEL
ncbi:MAG: serine/threonine-protein kinase, partial [Myxococcota bacterium]